MTPSAFADNGAWLHPIPPAKPLRPLHILAIGSSSTAGIGASAPGFTYPARLQADLARIWNIDAEVENAGVGSERAPATVGRLEAELQERPRDLVIWQVGTNDANSSEGESAFRSLVERGIGAAREAKTDIVLLDPQYYPGIRDLPRYETFVRIIGEVGAERHVPLFSRYGMMKAWSERSDDVLSTMLATDGFHMSDRGYGCLAQRLASDLAQRWGRPPVELVGAGRGKQSVGAGPAVPLDATLKVPVARTAPGGAT